MSSLKGHLFIFVCTGKDEGSPFIGEVSYVFVFFKIRMFLIIVGMVIDVVIEWKRRGTFFFTQGYIHFSIEMNLLTV